MVRAKDFKAFHFQHHEQVLPHGCVIFDEQDFFHGPIGFAILELGWK
jgi:hypothetical protein